MFGIWTICLLLAWMSTPWSFNYVPECSFCHQLKRIENSENLLALVFGGIAAQFFCIGIFAVLKYRCNAALEQYFINQAQLSLVERLRLDQNLKLSRTLLHSAIFYCFCHSKIIIGIFVFFWFKNALIVQEYHEEMASVFMVTAALLIAVIHPMIFLKEIPLLRQQLFVKVLMNVVKPADQHKKDEGDLRLENLSGMWNAAYNRRCTISQNR